MRVASAAAPESRISVIVPVLNEGARITRHLEQLTSLPGLHEVIVVDGGSTDRTAELAREMYGVRLVRQEAPYGLHRQSG